MAASSTRVKRRSIRERGKARRPNRTYYDLVVGEGDLAGLAAALGKAEAYLAATKTVQVAEDRKTEMIAAAQARYDDAHAALEAHRDRIWFEAIPDDEYERLRLQLLPTERTPGSEWPFIYALLAACAVDDDSTAEEWAEELASWSRAEKNAISEAVVDANTKPAAAILGKG